MYLLKKVEFPELVSFMFVSASVDFVEDYTVLPTIHAVEAIAHGVHETLQLKCGASYDSVCSK